MQYQLFIQNQSEHRFIASVVGMPMVQGEGVTEAEAIALAKSSLKSHLSTGKLVNIEVGISDETAIKKNDPWLKNMGLFANDSTFDGFLEEVAAYRQQVDEKVL
jgi:predicted RNase H-like HicB family nuclease